MHSHVLPRFQPNAQVAAPVRVETLGGLLRVAKRLFVGLEAELLVQPRQQHQALLQLEVGEVLASGRAPSARRHGGTRYESGANIRSLKSGSNAFAPSRKQMPLAYTTSASSAIFCARMNC